MWFLKRDASARSRIEPKVPGIAEAEIPSVDPGLPVRNSEDIVKANSEFIDRIKLAWGMSSQEFNRDIAPIIGAFAAYVHLLPATSDNYFQKPGGLFRLGLEIAHTSIQAADGQIFASRSTITERKKIEPKWRLACFIAGLLGEVHRTLSHLVVTDNHGNEWPAFLHPLGIWLNANRAERYYIRYKTNDREVRALGVFALPLIIPPTIMQYLADGNSTVVPHMMSSICGIPLFTDRNTLEQIVSRATAVVVDRNLRASSDAYGRIQLGSHLERYLVDAMRQLVLADGRWSVNREKSRVWFGPEGLFLVWPSSADDVRALLEAQKVPGLPRAPETILEILVSAGICEQASQNVATFQIYPTAEKAVEAVKLTSPMILLAGTEGDVQPRKEPLLRATTTKLSEATPVSPHRSTGENRDEEPAIQVPTAILSAEPAVQPSLFSTGETGELQNTHVIGESGKPKSADDRKELATKLKFNPPFSLDPSVGKCLSGIVDTMNGDLSAAAARTTADGIFVPLKQVESRGIQPIIAIRALSELKMLVVGEDPRVKTFSNEWFGEFVNGLVLDPQFVSGCDPDNFRGRNNQC